MKIRPHKILILLLFICSCRNNVYLMRTDTASCNVKEVAKFNYGLIEDRASSDRRCELSADALQKELDEGLRSVHSPEKGRFKYWCIRR